MATSFEVKECDLLGRLGTLRLGQRTLETPCLLPVVHPVSQSVPTRELKSMGFQGLMTNSYILGARRREEALKVGVHGLLGYEGVVFTDSGGYQALEYGDLGVGYREVASFQSGIGSDAAVTLDRPTGYPQKRAVARDTVEYSLRNAVSTLDEFGDSRTTWVGPIQGGLYSDLVRKSASGLVDAGFEILALGSPVQVMQNYMFADLARMIVAAKKAIPYSVPMHLFGAGHPLTMALAVALGCDTFDSASYILYARRGRYMGPSGVTMLKTMKYLPCSCPTCAKATVRGLLELPPMERTRMLAVHNLYVLRSEVEGCREAVAEGRLWDLVMEKSIAHPMLKAASSVLVENSDMLSEGTPSIKDRGLFLRTPEDLHRPELLLAGAKLARSLKRASKDAAVLVGGAGPSRRMPRRRGRREGQDFYKLHPVLGPYPVELDFMYPFAQTVTAAGTACYPPEEAGVRLRKIGYRSVSVVGSGKKQVTSRRNRRGASPSLRLSSARSR